VSAAQLLLRRLLDQAGGASETGYLLVIDGEGWRIYRNRCRPEGRLRRSQGVDRAWPAPPAVEGKGRAVDRCHARRRRPAYSESAGSPASGAQSTSARLVSKTTCWK